MEAMLKNMTSTAELLAVAAQSGVVEDWDKQTLSRAFHWARYCEHLFSRFHNNPAIRRVMEKQLQLTNQSLRAAFSGYSEVSFPDLSRCQHLLLIGLLNNPKLPSSIMKILFDSTSLVNTKNSEYPDVTGFCSHTIQCKSACKVLRSLTDRSLVGTDAQVQGMLLMVRLAALLDQGSETCWKEHFLDSVFQGCEGAAEHFTLVITAALLIPKNSSAEVASQDFLLNWLERKHSVLQLMCSTQPTTLLMELAKKHVKFRDAYFDLLKKWASEMEYSINDRVWIQTETTPTVSFQNLTEHFLALFEACPSQRDDVEKELIAFKISDGDYDVEGLSVWGDLLSVLH